MNHYSVSEVQLQRLAERSLSEKEWEELIGQIRMQRLIEVEKMRKAFKENYVKTEDELQKELLKIHEASGRTVPD